MLHWTATVLAAGGGGVDLLGVAAIITAVTGFIATVGALILGSRKRASDGSEALMAALLEREVARMKQDDHGEGAGG